MASAAVGAGEKHEYEVGDEKVGGGRGGHGGGDGGGHGGGGRSSGRRRKRKRLGEYVLVREVGAGATGTVWLAERRVEAGLGPPLSGVVIRGDGRLVAQVAIKSIAKAELKPKDLRRIAREILIMQQLKHPNIVQLHEVLETKTKLHLVIEYCAGGEVFEHVEKHGPMTEAYAKVVVRQVAEALKYCHRNGVAHRDVKLQNILMDASHQIVKLSDFGMSSMDVTTKSLLATACGTPYYVAPEVTSGQGYRGFPADVWSLGVCLYALIAGQFPFDGTSVRSVLQRARDGVFTMPGNASAELVELLRNTLNVDEDARWTIDDVLASAWLASLSGGPSGGRSARSLSSASASSPPLLSATLPLPGTADAAGGPSGERSDGTTDDDELDDWVWIDSTSSGAINTVDIAKTRAAGVRVVIPPRHPPAVPSAPARAPVVPSVPVPAMRASRPWMEAGAPSMSSVLSASSDSSVAWTPSAADMAHGTFVGTPTLFAEHQGPTTMFATPPSTALALPQTYEPEANIVLPDERLSDREMYASISSAWTHTSSTDSLVSSDDGHLDPSILPDRPGGLWARRGSGSGSDSGLGVRGPDSSSVSISLSLSDDLILGPVPPAADSPAANLAELPTAPPKV
ncbi:CAMK/CAMKL protein kinase [Thecamonas trahens ATCC 50062]|uniref:CAMK/CAMKL protein kinase n=1 Tax=Thecamonas trahens ATCC 50062 TaxID=461836 RepID=A0A0L0DDY3_THETB|nr:CAMK/CAMKL protein kinase [Thecamonas trahens ATCC 50062]KNC50425.1 CAMK/CAMKL protein kinase [Thecamonas trahens ATCC 50062]|eukprot:XP_013756966.1 CAMK/CAMKL protein kinase [Thecamonas trahens ATCC 50062]